MFSFVSYFCFPEESENVLVPKMAIQKEMSNPHFSESLLSDFMADSDLDFTISSQTHFHLLKRRKKI